LAGDGRVVSEPAGRNGKIDRQPLQLEDLKRFPDELDGEVFSQQRMDWTGRQANDFDVQIPGLPTEREVADAASDQPDPSAPATNDLLNTAKRLPERGIFQAKAGRH
jgi:hypothetical protein